MVNDISRRYLLLTLCMGLIVGVAGFALADDDDNDEKRQLTIAAVEKRADELAKKQKPYHGSKLNNLLRDALDAIADARKKKKEGKTYQSDLRRAMVKLNEYERDYPQQDTLDYIQSIRNRMPAGAENYGGKAYGDAKLDLGIGESMAKGEYTQVGEDPQKRYKEAKKYAQTAEKQLEQIRENIRRNRGYASDIRGIHSSVERQHNDFTKGKTLPGNIKRKKWYYGNSFNQAQNAYNWLKHRFTDGWPNVVEDQYDKTKNAYQQAEKDFTILRDFEKLFEDMAPIVATDSQAKRKSSFEIHLNKWENGLNKSWKDDEFSRHLADARAEDGLYLKIKKAFDPYITGDAEKKQEQMENLVGANEPSQTETPAQSLPESVPDFTASPGQSRNNPSVASAQEIQKTKAQVNQLIDLVEDSSRQAEYRNTANQQTELKPLENLRDEVAEHLIGTFSARGTDTTTLEAFKANGLYDQFVTEVTTARQSAIAEQQRWEGEKTQLLNSRTDLLNQANAQIQDALSSGLPQNDPAVSQLQGQIRSLQNQPLTSASDKTAFDNSMAAVQRGIEAFKEGVKTHKETQEAERTLRADAQKLWGRLNLDAIKESEILYKQYLDEAQWGVVLLLEQSYKNGQYQEFVKHASEKFQDQLNAAKEEMAGDQRTLDNLKADLRQAKQAAEHAPDYPDKAREIQAVVGINERDTLKAQISAANQKIERYNRIAEQAEAKKGEAEARARRTLQSRLEGLLSSNERPEYRIAGLPATLERMQAQEREIPPKIDSEASGTMVGRRIQPASNGFAIKGLLFGKEGDWSDFWIIDKPLGKPDAIGGMGKYDVVFYTKQNDALVSIEGSSRGSVSPLYVKVSVKGNHPGVIAYNVSWGGGGEVYYEQSR